MTSPTQRSLAWLREQGYLAQVVEHWNPFAKVRNDLFGFVDILAICGGCTLAVQTTSASHVSERIGKILASPAYRTVKDAGWMIEVHGWAKPTKRRRQWALRREHL